VAVNASVKVIKSFHFKGGTRSFSNRYHFNGGTPADGTHWDTLFTNVVTAEKAIFSSAVTIIECIGYAAGSDVPVRTKTFSTAGTLSPAAGGISTPGEVVALVRFSTAARSTKNHPIYLFKYFHGAYALADSSTSHDLLEANQKAAMSTYAGSWISGFSDGTITALLASPQGSLATGHAQEEYLTHRDFPSTTSL